MLVKPAEIVGLAVGIGASGALMHVPLMANVCSFLAILIGWTLIRAMARPKVRDHFTVEEADAALHAIELARMKEQARTLRNRPGPWDVDHSTMRTPPNKGNRFTHIWYRKK